MTRRSRPRTKTLFVGGLAALAIGVVGYQLYFFKVVNPRVVEELQSNPSGERAKKVMLLTLPQGRTIPVNYLHEDNRVYVGADYSWWKAYKGEGAAADILIQGRKLSSHGRAMLDDPENRDKVFSRLRPTAPAWIPEWAKGKLIVFTLSSE